MIKLPDSNYLVKPKRCFQVANRLSFYYEMVIIIDLVYLIFISLTNL